MNLTVIITAGGIGKRMGGKLPKQFLELTGKPILLRTVEAFFKFDPTAEILITLPLDWISFWNELCRQYSFEISHKVIEGGVERYDSIKNALAHASGQNILVHDGARPLVSANVIQKVVNSITNSNGVVPVVGLKSSLRKGEVESSKSVDRSEFWEVQTPQGFSKTTLNKAYNQPIDKNTTDDASLAEKAGALIKLVEGDEQNIKITTPLDLKIASVILES